MFVLCCSCGSVECVFVLFGWVLFVVFVVLGFVVFCVFLVCFLYACPSPVH